VNAELRNFESAYELRLSLVESKDERWRAPMKRRPEHRCLSCSRRIKWKLVFCCICWTDELVNMPWPAKPRPV
jgi:hypothetical protein